MDKIWYRNPSKSEVIGRCGGDGKLGDVDGGRKSLFEIYITDDVQGRWSAGWRNPLLLIRLTDLDKCLINLLL